MKDNMFQFLRIAIVAYVSIIVGMAVVFEHTWLAGFGLATGMICMWLVKKKLAVKTSDERTEHIAGRAATMTYSITSTALAALSLLLIFVPQNQPYLVSVGIILSYITLAMLGLFAILYRYYLGQESWRTVSKSYEPKKILLKKS